MLNNSGLTINTFTYRHLRFKIENKVIFLIDNEGKHSPVINNEGILPIFDKILEDNNVDKDVFIEVHEIFKNDLN